MYLLAKRTAPSRLPLEAFEADLRNGLQSSCLLTPTATMAEHIRHHHAREGLFVRPDSIVTLSRFVKPLVEDVTAASSLLLDRLVDHILKTNPPQVFAPLARSSGLRRILAGLIEELSTAGCDSGLLKQAVQSETALAFQQVYALVDKQLLERECVLRAGRLRVAAQRLRETGHRWKRIYLTGFYAFTPAELEILAALEPAEVLLNLPDWEGAAESRNALVRSGYETGHLDEEPLKPQSITVAASEQQEVDEIARRILAGVEAGRAFREIGIIVRRDNSYVPLLRTALRRYGIPARFYFPNTLAGHPVCRYLLGFLKALVSGWDHEALMPILRMQYSGIAGTDEADRIDFALRDRFPSQGSPSELEPLLPEWRLFEGWVRGQNEAKVWADKLQQLRQIVRLPKIIDRVPSEKILEWRELLSALDAWNECLEQTADSIPAQGPILLREFLAHLEEVVDYLPINGRDIRRNVVHVLDAYEARQWKLPVVFVCGLLERVFPQYHSVHPVLPDSDREALREFGVVLRTSAERQREEAVLFETALQCATERTHLSYPKTMAGAEETLPSFFLSRLTEALQTKAIPCRPRPFWPKAFLPPASIGDKKLLVSLKQARSHLSPTSIETYLQCPFQFFSRQVLKLKQPPPSPDERLDFLLQGSILHETLAETSGSPLFVEEIFTQLFDDKCREKSIPPSCRTERVKLEMHSNLRRFLESPPLSGATTLDVEKTFKLALSDDLRIRGKIDRLVQVTDRGLVVIDYKYSTKQRLRGRVLSHDRGELVQGGLYMWAAEKLYKKPIAGMLYCGLRGEVTWAGWHKPIFGWEEIGDVCDAPQMQEMIEKSAEVSLDVATRISSGQTGPEPADTLKCKWCEYQDCCRIETMPKAASVQMAGGDQ